MLQVGHDGTRATRAGRPTPQPPALRAPRRAGDARHPASRTWSTSEPSAPVISASRRQSCAPAVIEARLVLQQGPRHASGPILSSLSSARSAASGSLAPAPRKKPSASLRLLTLMTAGGMGSAANTSAMTRAISTSWWNGEGVTSDDVDVGLRELAVAALLRSFAAPHLLDLVAAKWKLEAAGVLQHIAGERNRQVEVQAELVGLAADV